MHVLHVTHVMSRKYALRNKNDRNDIYDNTLDNGFGSHTSHSLHRSNNPVTCIGVRNNSFYNL
jgi:hypothetical protein